MQRVLHPFILCLGMSFFLYIVGRNGEGVQYIGKKKVNFLGSLNGQSHHKKNASSGRFRSVSLAAVLINFQRLRLKI